MRRYELGKAGIPGLRIAEKGVPRPGPGQVLVRRYPESLRR